MGWTQTAWKHYSIYWTDYTGSTMKITRDLRGCWSSNLISSSQFLHKNKYIRVNIGAMSNHGCHSQFSYWTKNDQIFTKNCLGNDFMVSQLNQCSHCTICTYSIWHVSRAPAEENTDHTLITHKSVVWASELEYILYLFFTIMIWWYLHTLDNSFYMEG